MIFVGGDSVTGAIKEPDTGLHFPSFRSHCTDGYVIHSVSVQIDEANFLYVRVLDNNRTRVIETVDAISRGNGASIFDAVLQGNVCGCTIQGT